MIEALTEAQKKSIPNWIDLGLKIGYATETKPIDIEKVIELTNKHRKVCGVPEAKFFAVADSPYQACKVLKDKGITTSNALYGNQDIYWLNYYMYFRCELGLKEQTENIVYLHELCSHVSWMWMNETTTVVCRLPTKVHFTKQEFNYTLDGKEKVHLINVPHNFDEKAFEWADGSGFYSIYGTRIPEKYAWVIKTPADKLDATKILKIANEDIKAAAIKKIGVDKLFQKMKKKLLDEKSYEKGGNYKLWSVDFPPEREPRVYLQMACPSKKDVHIEAVPPDCRSVEAALVFRMPWDSDGNPISIKEIVEADTVNYLESVVHT